MKKARIVQELSISNPSAVAEAKIELKLAKTKHRNLVRNTQNYNNVQRDSNVFSILSTNPSAIYSKIKLGKASSTDQIPFLKVGNKEYWGENVKDGFYDSIKNLKTTTMPPESASIGWTGINIEEDYRNLLDICKNKKDL